MFHCLRGDRKTGANFLQVTPSFTGNKGQEIILGQVLTVNGLNDSWTPFIDGF